MAATAEASAVAAEAPEKLSSEAESFLSWLAVERGASPNTLEAYERDLRRYHRHLAMRGRTPADASADDVDAFVRGMLQDGLARSSVNRALSVVKGMHRHCEAEGLRSDDPTVDAEAPKRPLGLPRALTVGEVASLLEAVTGSDAVARRDRAMLEVLYGTGCRISELAGMSLADLDLREGLARITGKGSKERIVPLGRHAAAALEQWLALSGRSAMEPARWARRGDSEAVFLNQRGGRLTRQGIWLVVRRHGDAAGLRGRLTPHVLRHSCATHMLDGGADIRFVQELLGHSSISTTQIYTKVSAERLRAVYCAAHPRARLA